MQLVFLSFDYAIGDFFHLELPVIYNLFLKFNLTISYVNKNLSEIKKNYIEEHLKFIKITDLNNIKFCKNTFFLVWKKFNNTKQEKKWKQTYTKEDNPIFNEKYKNNCIFYKSFKNIYIKRNYCKIWKRYNLLNFFSNLYPTHNSKPNKKIKICIGTGGRCGILNFDINSNKLKDKNIYQNLIINFIKKNGFEKFEYSIYGLPDEIQDNLNEFLKENNLNLIGKADMHTLFNEINKHEIIITTSTSLSHMAGLLNKKVIVLLRPFTNNFTYFTNSKIKYLFDIQTKYKNYEIHSYTKNLKNLKHHPKNFIKWCPYSEEVIFINNNYLENLQKSIKSLI